MADANFIESCSACRFFLAPHGAIGVCRRYPTHQNRHGNDWCGEFGEKEIKRSAEEKKKILSEITEASLALLNKSIDELNGSDLIERVEEDFKTQNAKRGRKPKVQK